VSIVNGEVDEESLEIYLDVMDDRQAIVEPRPRSVALNPDGTDWHAYFLDMRAKEQANGSTGAIPPPTVEVRESVDEPDETGLGKHVASTLAAVRDAGWAEIRVRRSLIAVGDALYADDAKKKPGEEAPAYRKGDLKKAAHEYVQWSILAVQPAMHTGLRAHWREGVTPKGARSFKFDSALCCDPVGMPSELFADYAPDANALKQDKDEPGWAHQQRAHRIQANADRMDAQYNHGLSWQNTRPLFKSSKAFDAWLAEAVAITTPRTTS
jgi:hypothetical protein